MLILLGMLIDPNRCPADKVGGKNGHGFLQVNSRFGTYFEPMEIEDLFRFLDARLDGLASVVLAKPGGQIGCHRCLAEVCQGTVLEGLSGVKTLQCDIERVGTVLQLQSIPSDHLGVIPHTHPGGFGAYFCL